MRMIFVVIAIVLSCTASLGATIKGNATVIDGNRIIVGATVVGLYGIEAPESNQRCDLGNGTKWFCGRAAAIVLMHLVQENELRCKYETAPKDAIPEIRARCRVGDQDVGAAMVERGMAWATPDAPPEYRKLQATAAAKKIGIFQAPTERAADFRDRLWRKAKTDAPNHCPIKGNIDLMGRQIYHLPWSQWYALTKVSADQGERWFCSEKQAVEAGWQHAAWNFVPRLNPDDMPEGGVLRNQR
jgi:endonuclease YncB( thermonuclease family)